MAIDGGTVKAFLAQIDEIADGEYSEDFANGVQVGIGLALGMVKRVTEQRRPAGRRGPDGTPGEPPE